MLSCGHSHEKKVNGSLLLVMFYTIQFLGRQGLPLQGHIIPLMRLLANDNPQIHEWLSKKADKYTTPEIQNKILMLNSHMVLRDIATRIHQAEYFMIMAEECVGISNNEQLVVCFRYTLMRLWLCMKSACMGLYMCDNINIKSETIVKILEDVMLRV